MDVNNPTILLGVLSDMQHYRWQQAPQLAEAGVDNAQLLMMLPFEMMRQHLESVILRQFEIAFGIYSKQADELDNTSMTHIYEFEVTLRAKLEKIYTPGNK
ncbi:hypothetical protein ACFLTP_10090 [Chloroflexota bacterium]